MLKADHRRLTEGQPYAFAVSTVAKGTGVSTPISVTNADSFAVNDYVLIGSFGHGTSEIARVAGVGLIDHTVTLASVTRFAHPESTRITKLPYSQVRFFWTPVPPDPVPPEPVYEDAVPSFTGMTPLTGYLDIRTDSWFTTHSDDLHFTGYGWYVFRNPQTGYVSIQSNPIPYGGFGAHTAKETIEAFFSMLRMDDRKLVTDSDAFAWMNEGYMLARQNLNLVNDEYGASKESTVSVVPGVFEYRLPDDFSDLIYIAGSDGQEIRFIALSDIPLWNAVTGNTVRYYLRGKNIGFTPVPTVSATYSYRYRSKGLLIDSYEDELLLPDNGPYAVRDFMLSKAHEKLNNPQMSAKKRQDFDTAVNTMKMSAVKRSANLDNWSIAKESNV